MRTIRGSTDAEIADASGRGEFAPCGPRFLLLSVRRRDLAIVASRLRWRPSPSSTGPLAFGSLSEPPHERPRPFVATMLALLHQFPALDSRTANCGTRRAFIDLGANDGQSLQWFEKNVAAVAEKPYTQVVAFEMNPAFKPVLKSILARLPGGELERAAAFTRSGEMEAAMQLPGGRTGSKHGVFYNMTSSSLIDANGVALNRRSKKSTSSCATSADVARCCRRHPKACKAEPRRRRRPRAHRRFWAVARVALLQGGLRPRQNGHRGRGIRGGAPPRPHGAAQLIDEIAIEWHLAKVGPKKASQRREEMNLLVRDLKAAGAKARDWQL